MDFESIIADAVSVLNLAQLAVKVGASALPFVETAYDILVNKQPLTDDQRTALLQQEADLRTQLNTDPLPQDAP